MRIVFIGAEQAGYDVLEMLLKTEDVVGVIMINKSDSVADWVDFYPLYQKVWDNSGADSYSVDLYSVDKISDANIARIEDLKPDLIIVVSWSQIIPKEILDIAPTIGIHYSLLPERRGGAPIAWALIDGLKESGITLFYYTEKIDAGDIIAQKRFRIRDTDNPSTLLKVINRLCVEIVQENLPLIKDGKADRFRQIEARATHTKKRTPADSEIDVDWLENIELPELYDFIRALSDPYPNAFFTFGNKRIILSDPDISHDSKKLYCVCTITEVSDE